MEVGDKVYNYEYLCFTEIGSTNTTNTTILHKTQTAKSETLETLMKEQRKETNTSHAINNDKE